MITHRGRISAWLMMAAAAAMLGAPHASAEPNAAGQPGQPEPVLDTVSVHVTTYRRRPATDT